MLVRLPAGRPAHDALWDLRNGFMDVGLGLRWVVDVDISKYLEMAS